MNDEEALRDGPQESGEALEAPGSPSPESKPTLPVQIQVNGTGGAIHLPEHSARILLNLCQVTTIKDSGMKLQVGIAQMDLEKALVALEEGQKTKEEKKTAGADRAAAAAAARQRNGSS